MTEPLCREADSDAPCRYWETCPETRRRLQHYAGLQGEMCWAFVQISEKLATSESAARVPHQ